MLKTKTIEMVKEFRLLQKMNKPAKGKPSADAAGKEAGDKEEEEEEEDDELDEGNLELTMRQQNFCESRQELMDSIRSWAKESANQMAAFPSNRSKARAKRTVDFINMMKISIRKTTPLGGEEEDETDQAWLDKYNEPLPEPDELAAVNSTFKDKLKAARTTMMSVMPVMPASPFRATSTPESNPKGRKETPSSQPRDERGRFVKKGTDDKIIPTKSGGEEEGTDKEKKDEDDDHRRLKEILPHHVCAIDAKVDEAKRSKTDKKKGKQEKQIKKLLLDEVYDEARKLVPEWEGLPEPPAQGAEGGEKTGREKEEDEIRKRAADLMAEVGDQDLARQVIEAQEKLLESKKAAEEEIRKVKEQEEEIEKQKAQESAERDAKRKANEEELKEILKRLQAMEEVEKDKKEMALRKAEMMRQAKGPEVKDQKKRRAPSSSSSEDATSDDEGGQWQDVKRKKKQKKKDESETSDSETTSSTGTDSSEDEKKGKKTLKQVKLEQLARSRMIEARPKNDSEKFGDDGDISYQTFKNRFNAVTKVEGINALDVLNEITNWLKGTPMRMAQAYKGAEDPKEAMKEVWAQLDRYYMIRSLTAHERIQPILSKGKILKEDIDAHIDLVADLANVKTEARIAKMAKQLDRGDIIRDIVNGKLSYMAEEFYNEEAKKKRENPKFRYKFQDVIDIVSEKAQILKARGITSKGQQTVKVAATQGMTGDNNALYSRAAKSPPKAQPPLMKCELCQSSSHSIEKCNKLSTMSLADKAKEYRRLRYCFRCSKKGHIAKFCQNEPNKCGECGQLGHPTILHGWRELQQQLRAEANKTANNNAQGNNNQNNRGNPGNTGPKPTPANPQRNTNQSAENNNNIASSSNNSSSANQPIAPPDQL